MNCPAAKRWRDSCGDFGAVEGQFAFVLSIDSLMDALHERPLTSEERGFLERELLTNDASLRRYLNRCQLEADLFTFMGGHETAEFPLVDRGAVAHELEDE
jgi:hypothetical protein